MTRDAEDWMTEVAMPAGSEASIGETLRPIRLEKGHALRRLASRTFGEPERRAAQTAPRGKRR